MKQKRFSSLKSFLICSTAMIMIFGFVVSAYATNGMNLEGYGPIATGMGGASMAYDNGTAAMMNNPATLSLMPEGNRLDVALGYLGPHVSASMPEIPGVMPAMSADSSGTAYYMPAIGWANKSAQLTYGVGVFAQGGMGTEYAADSFLAANSGDKVRSEVSVGRLLIPVAYEINKEFSIAGSLDFVWAGMDIKMALPGDQFIDMAPFPGSTQTFGTVSGSMMDSFGDFYGHGGMQPGTPVNWGRFDFTNGSDFTGEAMGTGLAGKIGGVYKAGEKLTLGMAYHSKTALSDLETDNAKVTFNANVDQGYITTGTPDGNYVATNIPVSGKIAVKEFEWPQMLGLGAAYQASDKLLLVADYKWINWKDVMKDFKMTFTADADQSDPMAQNFANTVLDTTMYQNWKDQNVFMLGAGYKTTEEVTLRAGLNLANNPIPDKYMNPLFPAIIKNHIMLGGGYMVSKASSVDASFTYAPEVKQTNGQGVEVTHSQTNAQVMYSYRF